MISQFSRLTKESPGFPVSSARPAHRKNSGPAPVIVDSEAHPPPRSYKWKQPFVWGEGSRFTADGVHTKESSTVTTEPGWASPTFTQCGLTPCFTQPLMQTQLLLSPSIQALLLQNRDRPSLLSVDGVTTMIIFSCLLLCPSARLCIFLKDRVSCLDFNTYLRETQKKIQGLV